MKNNYEDILIRVESIIRAIPLLDSTEKITNLLKEVTLYNNYIKEAINESTNKVIQELEKEVETLQKYKKIYLINKNFYDALGINRILYRIDNPDILESFNLDLIRLIRILEKQKIVITKEDFNYTTYVNKYMTVLLDNIGKEGFTQIMKNTFDGIYWEEHDILDNIAVNIKNIFTKNEKFIKDEAQQKLKDYVVENNINEEEAFKKLYETKIKLRDLKDTDPIYIKKLFIEEKINPADYNNNQILNTINTLNPHFNTFDNNTKNKFFDDVRLCKYELDEYKNYLKYKYLIDDVKKMIDNKNVTASNYQKKEKELQIKTKEHQKLVQKEKKLKDKKEKILKKNTSTFFKEKNKIDKVSVIDEELKSLKEFINPLNDNIKEITKNKDRYKFETTLVNTINDESKIDDVLKLFLSSYTILYDSIKGHYEEINDIENRIVDFYNFMTYTDKVIINNINFKEYENINNIIEDKYKSLNILLDLNDIENAYKNVTTLYNYRNIKYSKINLETIKERLEK